MCSEGLLQIKKLITIWLYKTVLPGYNAYSVLDTFLKDMIGRKCA